MAGTIKHYWNGTVLTIESDSGISSMDLKGTTGDIGVRGPQGAPGVVVFDKLTPEQQAMVKGEKGDQGLQGIQGNPGKSAYAYAVESGYKGTEAQFINAINPDTLQKVRHILV